MMMMMILRLSNAEIAHLVDIADKVIYVWYKWRWWWSTFTHKTFFCFLSSQKLELVLFSEPWWIHLLWGVCWRKWKTKERGKIWCQLHLTFYHDQWSIGCIDFFLNLIFIRLTLFSLYFLILRTIYFLTFFYLRPPSFANFNFCLLMGIRRNFNGKIIRFLIPCRNMVYIWSIWF